MPYVARYGQSKMLDAGGASPADTIGSSSAPVSDAAPTSTATQQPQAGSGAFTDLGSYMTANADQASALANKIMGQAGAQATQAATPTSAVMRRAGREGAPQYVWPTTDAQRQTRDAARANIDNLLTDSGRKDYVSQMAGPGYTAGQANLDGALLGGSPWDSLKSYYGALDAAAGYTQPPQTTPLGFQVAQQPTPPPKPTGTPIYNAETPHYDPDPGAPTYDDSNKGKPPASGAPIYDDSNRFKSKKAGGW